MIYAKFAIINPWHKNKFKNVVNWSKLVRKNKAIEFEVIYTDYELLKGEFELSFNKDHAGLDLKLGLLGYSIEFTLYDTRHWDEEKGAWKNYDNDNINS